MLIVFYVFTFFVQTAIPHILTLASSLFIAHYRLLTTMLIRAHNPQSLTLARLGSALALALASAGPVQAVDYLQEVKPIFSEHCYRCHGSIQQKNGLRLDTAASALKGGDHGPAIVPGKSAESLIIQALQGTHATLPQMPYKKPALSDAQIASVAAWINEGAPVPQDEEAETATHWSFIPPERPSIPTVESTSIRNPIDNFIQTRLAEDNISPTPEADRATLLRRLHLDLIGLPPTPAELDDFLADNRSDAYERAVERLLASAHYGERWGRWWLDAARYADSNGYSIDSPREIWKYRDWVVAAINRDQPFDQFSIEQLAGDLIPNATVDQKIATGFNRNTQINQEGGIDPEQFRVESVIDRVNTFGTVFLGLTVACSQCHDHKFDPISQLDYYNLYAFFNTTVQDGHGGGPRGVLAIPGEFESTEGWDEELQAAENDLARYLDKKESEVATWSKGLTEEERSSLKENAQQALEKNWSDLSLTEKRALFAAFKADDGGFKSRDSKLTKLEKRKPKPITTLVMEEAKEPRESFLFTKGDFTRPANKVDPATPAVLHPLSGAEGRALNRLDLAKWLFEPANPVTARVIVNRVWQQYFGYGLVETENDFGTQGSLPTHPDLLDWLATEFMSPTVSSATPWSLKHLHRLIVTSATYRQSSKVRPELANIDPNNKLLARQSRLRLDAEVVRDVAITASGLLSPEIGGPPVYPPQPDGVMSLGQVRRSWNASEGSDRFRRALYTHFWRATPHPALAVFDAPDAFSTCTRRIRSNTPLQALTLLNDQQFFECAEALAARLEKEVTTGSDHEKITHAFRLCLSRNPSPVEQDRLQKLLAESGSDRWLTVARVLLNLDETITRE